MRRKGKAGEFGLCRRNKIWIPAAKFEEFCKRKFDKHGTPFCAVFVFYLYVNYPAKLDVYHNCGSLRDFLKPHIRIIENSRVTNSNCKLVC